MSSFFSSIFGKEAATKSPEQVLDDGWTEIDRLIFETRTAFSNQLEIIEAQIEYLLNLADERYTFETESKEKRRFYVKREVLQGRQRNIKRARKLILDIFDGITSADDSRSSKSSPKIPSIRASDLESEAYIDACLQLVDHDIVSSKEIFEAELGTTEGCIRGLFESSDMAADLHFTQETAEKRRFYVKQEILHERLMTIETAKALCALTFQGITYDPSPRTD